MIPKLTKNAQGCDGSDMCVEPNIYDSLAAKNKCRSLFPTDHLFFVFGQLQVDVACVFLDAVCTADEAIKMVPHQVLELARL